MASDIWELNPELEIDSKIDRFYLNNVSISVLHHAEDEEIRIVIYHADNPDKKSQPIILTEKTFPACNSIIKAIESIASWL